MNGRKVRRFSIFMLVTLLSSTLSADSANVGKIRIQSNPRVCVASVTDTSGVVWTKKGKWQEAEVIEGEHQAVVRGKDAEIAFQFLIESHRSTEALVDFVSGNVQLQLSKDSGSKTIPCIITTDSGTVFEPPVMIQEEAPEYSVFAMSRGMEGAVLLRVLVGNAGEVREAQVYKTSNHKLLDKAAVAAAYRCRFKPGVMNGKPTSCWIQYPVTFSLSGN
jgi:TonB family protein